MPAVAAVAVLHLLKEDVTHPSAVPITPNDSSSSRSRSSSSSSRSSTIIISSSGSSSSNRGRGAIYLRMDFPRAFT